MVKMEQYTFNLNKDHVLELIAQNELSEDDFRRMLDLSALEYSYFLNSKECHDIESLNKLMDILRVDRFDVVIGHIKIKTLLFKDNNAKYYYLDNLPYDESIF